jgi:DNA repair protein RecN (Recombination protein N)
MIIALHIKNYALISDLEINFEKGFTIITGETGAGKSILLGALNLIAGQRADTSVLLNKDIKCIVEAEFDISKLDLKSFFEENDLDYNHKSTIRREISSNGKTRAFVNDTPVNLGLLKELSQRLIDVHSQHQSLEINEKNSQLNYLDVIAGHDKNLVEYFTLFNEYKSLQQKLSKAIDDEKQLRKDFDYFQFQWQEIDDLKLKAQELKEIKAELAIITHAEEIKLNLTKVFHLLQEKDGSVITQLNESKNAIAHIARYDKELEEILKRLQSTHIELKDIVNEIESKLELVSFDPERLNFLNERMSNAERLMRKHQVKDEEELINLKLNFESKIIGVDSLAEEIERLKIELKSIEESLLKNALKLRKQRSNAIPNFEKQAVAILQQLGMPNSKFKIHLNTLPHFTQNGCDEVDFLFSANKGIAPAPLNKVASGGELSRIMLAVKSIIAKEKTLPSIIFDEIDTGVSGDVAAKMAIILKNLAEHLQVISITHLPQIASKGHQHWFVYKDNEKDITTSHIKILNQEERIHEIAKMLSNEKTSVAAVNNAKELLGFQTKKVSK